MQNPRLVWTMLLSLSLVTGCVSPKLDEQEESVQKVEAEHPSPNEIYECHLPIDKGITSIFGLPESSIYFGFDNDQIIGKKNIDALETAAQHLKQDKRISVLIQGNADERGSSEYNLALGQRRAEAVLQSLAVLGVSKSQMEAVSLGKEKPKALGHDESSWKENRRVDFWQTYGSKLKSETALDSEKK